MKSIKKSFSKISPLNKSNTWLIILAVGALFVVLYYFLGKRFGLREGQEDASNSATDGSDSTRGVSDIANGGSDSTGGVSNIADGGSDIADGGSDSATGGDTVVPNATGGGRGGGARKAMRRVGKTQPNAGGSGPNATSGGIPNATSGSGPNVTSGGRGGGRDDVSTKSTIGGTTPPDSTLALFDISKETEVSKDTLNQNLDRSGSTGENALLSNIQKATLMLQNERLSQQKDRFDKVITDEENTLASMQTTLKNIEDKTHAIFKRQMTRPMAKSKDTTPKKSTSKKVVLKNDPQSNDE
jgi:hypothetical protein